MSYGNYGGGRRRGGGGGNFTPKPRPQLPQEHQLHPLAEACCSHENKGMLRDYSARGSEMSRDTVLIDGDPSRAPIPVPIACMYAYSQFGVPKDHPEFPALKKHDTRYEGNHYYAVYASPIMWQHNTADTDFRHIPQFTRYVMDSHKRVLNAHNGMEIKPLNPFMIELVPDGPTNKLTKINLDQLAYLAFTALPDDFIDYGFKNSSHDFGLDMGKGTFGLNPKNKVKVKNNETGMAAEFGNVTEFLKREVPPKEFQLMVDINNRVREGFKGEVLNIGPFTMKESVDFKPAPPLPVVQATDVHQAPAEAPAPSEQAPMPSEDTFKDPDFDF